MHAADVRPDARPYLVTELCEGSLADRIAARGRLDPHEVTAVGLVVGRALLHAHDARVRHGDLTPESVLFRDGAVPVLADFEPAVLRDYRDPGEPTPTHAAPETVRADGAVDERTDVYGLGAILYTALAGGRRCPRGTASRSATGSRASCSTAGGPARTVVAGGPGAGDAREGAGGAADVARGGRPRGGRTGDRTGASVSAARSGIVAGLVRSRDRPRGFGTRPANRHRSRSRPSGGGTGRGLGSSAGPAGIGPRSRPSGGGTGPGPRHSAEPPAWSLRSRRGRSRRRTPPARRTDGHDDRAPDDTVAWALTACVLALGGRRRRERPPGLARHRLTLARIAPQRRPPARRARGRPSARAAGTRGRRPRQGGRPAPGQPRYRVAARTRAQRVAPPALSRIASAAAQARTARPPAGSATPDHNASSTHRPTVPARRRCREHRRGGRPQVADGHVRGGVEAVVTQPVAHLQPRPDHAPPPARRRRRARRTCLTSGYSEHASSTRPATPAAAGRHDDVHGPASTAARVRGAGRGSDGGGRHGAGRGGGAPPAAARSPSPPRSGPPDRSPRGRRPLGSSGTQPAPATATSATRTRRRCGRPAAVAPGRARAGNRRRGGRDPGRPRHEDVGGRDCSLRAGFDVVRKSTICTSSLPVGAGHPGEPVLVAEPALEHAGPVVTNAARRATPRSPRPGLPRAARR